MTESHPIAAAAVDAAPEPPPHRRPPLVLIADDQEWSARAFESVLGPAGYAVLRCPSARAALEQVRTVSPDAVMVKADLGDADGPALCRHLREEPRVGPSTPLFVTFAAPARREDRMEALRAGAWDVLTLPLDAEELTLRLGVFVQAKMEADRTREESLVDPLTGLYSLQGVLRRAREMGLDAIRQSAPLGCVVLAGEEPPPDSPAAQDALLRDRMVRLVEHAGRRSDVVGRLGRAELAVLTPHTGSDGVMRLADRLLARADEEAREVPGQGPLHLRVGCYAVENLAGVPLDPVELLVRATMALRRAQRDPAAGRVCFFDEGLAAS